MTAESSGTARTLVTMSVGASAVASVLRRVALLLGVSVLAGVLVAGLVLPLAGGLGLAARAGAEAFQELPSEFTTQPMHERTRVLDADGQVLAIFYDENRVVVPLRRIAPVLRKAIVAIEDARFFEHGPIDLRGTTRAFAVNLQSGGVTQGGSTLTQQYVKNVLISQADTAAEAEAAREASYGRKLRELRLAIAAERQFTKREILERYLNIAYYGGGTYGAEMAARHYFSIPAAELSLPQAALLAGLVQSPSRYDPELYPKRAKTRRNLVLAVMADTGAIKRGVARDAQRSRLGLDVRDAGNGCGWSYAPFFCDYVKRQLLSWEGLGATRRERRDSLYRGGLTIRTTLRPALQEAAQQAVEAYVDPRDFAIGALSQVQPGTGRVTAMAQSRGFGSGPGKDFVNYNTDFAQGGSSGFQAGSTFKVFVLAAAIQQGIPLNTRIESPQEIVVRRPYTTCDGVHEDPWRVQNSTGAGTYDLRTGTWRSVNTFFARLEGRTGICAPWQIATDLGVTQASGDPLEQYKSFPLGPFEVSPLAMAEAYATFAARGVHCEAVAVSRIVDRNGQRLPVPPADCAPVLDSTVADTVNHVLAGVIDGPDPYRTGQAMTLGRPAAGKTGTTNDSLAVWFAGYTPDLATAVTVADPDLPRQSLDKKTIGGTFYEDACGSCIAGPIWREAMERAVKGTPVSKFVAPPPEVITGPTAAVPDVRGLDYGTAAATLTEAGFDFAIAGSVASALSSGQVVYTDPASGVSAPLGSEIELFLSIGFPTATPSPSPTSPSPLPSTSPSPSPTLLSPSPSPTSLSPSPSPTSASPTPSGIPFTPTISPTATPTVTTSPTAATTPPTSPATPPAVPTDTATDG